ncbi:mycothiol synthase [Corynebacterium heidelbergense]|uniref:Mycothiol acetyltransferase n=1 Tax=Corynebacterium heidelbergense TaxID=2055947 RepID=A0A364VA56_9CORY|nr:mycothiol synthase [Corynebacterium heidelbergense]RAV33494.1 mycothiol synthase [Corynebacterium heidelbergense]WCZ35958.1 Mycothiol acetyltransferase [Corynebacterium heidelbergense]
MQPAESTINVIDELHSKQELCGAVLRVVGAAEEADGVAPLSEAFLRGIQEDLGHRHLVAVDANHPQEVWGVLAVDRDSVVELAVLPEHRHEGVGSALIDRLRQLDGDHCPIDVWAHGDLPAARKFVGAMEARKTRELLKMSLEVTAGSGTREQLRERVTQAEKFVAQAGYRVMTYPEAAAEFGEETVDREWLRVNNEAFAWHPEQGGWDLPRLEQARAARWFDPNGVISLWKGEEPQCLGFHWTKIPEGAQEGQEGGEDKAGQGGHEGEAGLKEGEVYVVCLADAARGQGLGGPITLLGMGWLLECGVEQINLYVEGANAPAIATYEKLGFQITHTDVVYRGYL